MSPPIYDFQLHQDVEFNPGLYDPDYDSLDVRIADTLKELGNFKIGNIFPPPYPFQIVGFSTVDANGIPNPNIMTNNMFYAPVPGATGANPQRYTPDNPFDTDSTFKLDHRTGKTTFKAHSIMEPALFYSAKDYRNNKFVSESYCVGQFTILNDARLPSYMRIDTASIQGISSFNNQGMMVGCPGNPISFDAYVKLPGGPTGNLVVRTTADTTVPGNGVCNISGLHTDSVHLKFAWTPPLNAKGLYNVFVSAKDSNCVAPYHEYVQVYTWSFHIDSCLSPLNLTPPFDKLRMTGDVLLYPNPANEELVITAGENFSDVKIFSLLSELVYEKKIKGTKRLDVSTKDLPNGMYIVNIDGKYIRKLVIQR